MIGSDPKYQAIIDAYKAGQLATTAPQYNPIYDIRSEQIAAGKLPAGSQFPNPQLDTTPTTEAPKETFDPCPPGYQLIDGVCQPDTMFQQGGGNDREPYTGPKISPEGLIEGYEQVLSPGMGAMNSMQMMELEKRFGEDRAKEIGLLNQKYRNRGVQYDPVNDRFVAMSPTLSQLAGDIAGGFGNMFGSVTDAAMNYLGSGGLLGILKDAIFPTPPTIRTGGSVTSSVTESPMLNQEAIQTVVPTGINRPGYSLPQPKIDITFPSEEKKDSTPKTPKAGTGASGAPGRNYSTPARSRAAQAASKLGKSLATRGR